MTQLLNPQHQLVLEKLIQEHARRKQERQAYDWSIQARPQQLPPKGNWRIWLILAGRGFGKTRTGAETIRWWATNGVYRRICLLAHHHDDARKVMVEGPSGLLSISPSWEGVTYSASRRMLSWPGGAKAFMYSASAPQQLRGPQFDAAWIDELAKFPDIETVWDQLMFSLRLGNMPRLVITTTPTPCAFLKELMGREDVHITTGTTFDNAHNLASGYLETLKKRYCNTRIGLQEIEGKVLEDDVPDALWKGHVLKDVLLPLDQEPPPLSRVVVAVDPAVTHHANSDETGLIVAGTDAKGHAYVLEDLSGKWSPSQWGSKAVEAYHRHQADRVLAEVNNGGDLVEKLIHAVDATVSFKAVRASRGKHIRAEPIAALYEQNRVTHLKHFPELVEQMLTFTTKSGKSPDRLDALVWALTELCLVQKKQSKKNRPQVWGT